MESVQYIYPHRRLFGMAIVGMLLAGFIAILQGQPSDWDLLHYHYYVGYAALHHRIGYDIMPAGEHTYLNPLLDMLNYVLMTTQKPIVIVFCKGMLSGLNIFLLFLISQWVFRAESPMARRYDLLFALLIGASGAANLTVIGSFSNDVETTLLVMTALYCLLRAISAPALAQQRRLVAFAGWLAGMAVGLKMVTVSYAMGMTMALLWTQRHDKMSLGIWLGLLVAGFGCTGGYWMYYLYSHYQSPLFPFYNNFFQSPYLDPMRIEPSNIRTHYFTLPFYLARQHSELGECGDARFATLVVLLGLIALKRFIIRRPLSATVAVEWRFLSCMAMVSGLIWFVIFLDYRYLLPLELLTGLLMVGCMKPLLGRQRLYFWSMAVLTVALCFTTRPIMWDKMPFQTPYFRVTAPHLPPHAIVFIANDNLLYMAPFFQPDTRFVGLPFIAPLHSLYAKTNIANKLNDKVRELLQQGTPVYTLMLFTPRTTLGKRAFFPEASRPRTDNDWQLTNKFLDWHILRINEDWASEQANSRWVSEQVNGRWLYDAMDIREVADLPAFLAHIPKSTLYADFSAPQKQRFLQLMHAYEQRYPLFEPNSKLRMIYYYYGLIKDLPHCQQVLTSFNQMVELCPLVHVHQEA